MKDNRELVKEQDIVQVARLSSEICDEFQGQQVATKNVIGLAVYLQRKIKFTLILNLS